MLCFHTLSSVPPLTPAKTHPHEMFLCWFPSSGAQLPSAIDGWFTSTFPLNRQGLDFSSRRMLFSTSRCPLQLVCSSRNPGRPRGPLWRGRVLTNESLRVVQELKRAKGDAERTAAIFRTKISRLLKADLVAVLGELQRQDECELALQIFNVARKETWYKPDVHLYSDMITTLGRNRLIEEVEKLFTISKEEGLEPHTRLYTEVLGAYLRSNNTEKAMEVYEEMKKVGCSPSEFTFGILLKGLEINRELDLAAAVRREYKEALTLGQMEQAIIS